MFAIGICFYRYRSLRELTLAATSVGCEGSEVCVVRLSLVVAFVVFVVDAEWTSLSLVREIVLQMVVRRRQSNCRNSLR